MIKSKWISVFVFLFLLACQSPEPAPPPNIVYINIDDLGYKDLGFMGSKYYETPNLDQLASQGMIFTQAYAAASNCAPSRAGLMSGFYSPRHRIYTVGNSDRGDNRTRKIIPVPNQETLADSIRTLAEMLQDQGYITASLGKWHLGQTPVNQGFDLNVAGSHRGNPGKDGYFSPYNVDHLNDGPEGEYLTDRLTDEAIDFLHTYQDSSFFLYLPYYTVHTPLMGKPELVNKYRQKPDEPGQSNPVYGAMVTAMDQNIGRLLNTLDQLDLTEKTLLIFTSDNGGIRAVSSQAPLRAGKGSYYEGGIRVPLVIRWPDQVEAGSICEVPVINLDFYPTIARILQVESLPHLDGLDISPIWQGGTIPDRELYWHFPIYLQAYSTQMDDGRDPLFRTRPGTVIRKGDWKLHLYYEDQGIELYNLAMDPGERNNLVFQHPDKVQELNQSLVKWMQEMDAPIPLQPNPEYDSMYESSIID
ncbi:MAG: sulfatase [Candidatus Cyclobacteriaceae bacterium M3_2C_046]